MTTDTGRTEPSDPRKGRNSRGPWYAQDFATAPYRPTTSRPSGNRRRGRPRKSTVIVAAVVAAVLVAVAAVTVSGARNAPTNGFVPTGNSPGQDAKQITSAFLAAWKSGNFRQAARYTDHPSAAGAALLAYRDHLHLKKLIGATVGTAAVSAGAVGTAAAGGAARPREHVTFTVNATVAATAGQKTLTGPWHYHSSLVAYQQRDSKAWYIVWSPDVLAPGLTVTTHLAAVAVPPHPASVTDSSGNSLVSYGDAGLTTIAGVLRQQGPPSGQGSPGLSVVLQTAAGKTVAGSQAAVIAPGTVPSVATTISARAEAAARRAAAEHKDTSIVAIQPSTGKVLAIANNDGYNDFALTAAVAPGSTGKIISATALLADHVLTPDSHVSCPETYTVQGTTYHNDHNETEPASTSLTTDFAQSCNNAFDQWWPDLENGHLAATARKYYGLNEPWDLGIGHSATYYHTPADASGSEVAMEAFGDGAISASPLAIASVAATIDTGVFRQPILVPGARQITATPLPASTDAGLKTMMRAVVSTGTAAGLGFGTAVYAKTGTADISGQEQPNSWFTAFDSSKDVAVTSLVLDAGYGAQYAAPAARAFLSQY
jgi:transpeptidase family protein